MDNQEDQKISPKVIERRLNSTEQEALRFLQKNVWELIERKNIKNLREKIRVSIPGSVKVSFDNLKFLDPLNAETTIAKYDIHDGHSLGETHVTIGGAKNKIPGMDLMSVVLTEPEGGKNDFNVVYGYYDLDSGRHFLCYSDSRAGLGEDVNRALDQNSIVEVTGTTAGDLFVRFLVGALNSLDGSVEQNSSIG